MKCFHSFCYYGLIAIGDTARRIGAVLGDVIFFEAEDRFYLNIVPAFKARNEEMPVPFMIDDLDFWKLVYSKIKGF